VDAGAGVCGADYVAADTAVVAARAAVAVTPEMTHVYLLGANISQVLTILASNASLKRDRVQAEK